MLKWPSPVIAMDDEVDRLNEEAYYALTNLIRSEPEKTPQALSAILICRNVERVGDHATNIAEDVIFWVRGRRCSPSDVTRRGCRQLVNCQSSSLADDVDQVYRGKIQRTHTMGRGSCSAARSDVA